MMRVIIESPYAGEIESNISYAQWCLRHSLDMGEAPFASHLIYTYVLDDTDPLERDRGLQAAYEWMSAADVVAFYLDKGWSKGMIKALKVARLLRKKIELRFLWGGPKDYLPPTPEVHEELMAAGIIEELPPPAPGVRAFDFCKKPFKYEDRE